MQSSTLNWLTRRSASSSTASSPSPTRVGSTSMQTDGSMSTWDSRKSYRGKRCVKAIGKIYNYDAFDYIWFLFHRSCGMRWPRSWEACLASRTAGTGQSASWAQGRAGLQPRISCSGERKKRKPSCFSSIHNIFVCIFSVLEQIFPSVSETMNLVRVGAEDSGVCNRYQCNPQLKESKWTAWSFISLGIS